VTATVVKFDPEKRWFQVNRRSGLFKNDATGNFDFLNVLFSAKKATLE
jgi:hypothetical protein